MMAFATSLSEKVWKKIGRLNNVTRVWEELDRHYGAPKIVTAEVLAELHDLGSKRGKQDFIPNFTIMLEDAARLLVTIDSGERVKSEQQVEHCAYPRCGKTGHTIVKCGIKKSDQTRLANEAGGGSLRGECNGCGEIGHKQYLGPNPGREWSASEGGVQKRRDQGQFSSHCLTRPKTIYS